MSYFKVENQLVYMPEEKYSHILIQELNVSDYQGYYIMTNSEKKPSDQIRHEAMVYDFLKSLYESDRELFLRQWVRFELAGENAQNNIWHLLYDYCLCYGHALLSDPRSDHKQMMDDLMGNTTQSLPTGNIFSLLIRTKPYKFTLKKAPKVRILIDAEKAVKIVGQLSNFAIYFENNSVISCSDNITVKLF